MRKWWPLVAVCLGTFMLLLDVTIVTVALPEMASGLHASLDGLQWVVDVYALALAALLLGAGATADAIGRRRVYTAGTVVFAAASLACGLSGSAGMLVAMRALQGVGGAAMFATTLSLLGAAYQGRERGVAFGVWGAVSGAAAALGPVLGGVLTEDLGWRWIFFVNLPVSVAAVALTLRVVTESRGAAGRRVDVAGTAAWTLFAGTATYAVIRADAIGWGSARTLGVLAVAVVALAAFWLAERRAEHPLLDPRLFRSASFTAVMVAAFALNAAAFGLLPYTSIWLQTVLGFSPLAGGLVLVPLAGASFVVAAVGGRLLHGVPVRLTVGCGLLLIAAGAAGQAWLGAGSGWFAPTPGLLVTGAGVGLVTPSLSQAALASVPPHRAGMAGGAVNTFRQLGYALGVALFGALATSRMAHGLTGHVPDPHGASRALAGGGAPRLLAHVPAAHRAAAGHVLRAAFTSGLDAAAWAAAGVGLVAGALVLWLVRPGAPSPVAGSGGGVPRPVAAGAGADR
ncbi:MULTISPECIES: MFS transporter [Streptomycetaceae]|uniref:Integral membrane efflux protein n=1 Tax=Streptantibioticus cattleyicolor (strain ATCC 35852 / DSM 46488 / JCM 4925 / NBRC 14057 / NRRL 8057) TaxID=1003195 RepID=F8JZH6_STREN|nr:MULTISPECIES: MFS transporter [Streptomycetaceae]AEW97278.1 integral membrane efflux protein [Streptantibioticus cattleyicolor NRRL 8057 = DSM 46488]MYS61730.1 DHA2 family efflux MFS transporter permease subunit [Streptomyces sp. SID5468]CCB77598.1 putative integral membrane efflux protein [Streptantibioticus cattleyicolor NRRL 8057 = DSM 46488]